jgi:Cd2+/Zn2+-exporting ATPase
VLSIEAPKELWADVVAAIGKAGFKSESLVQPVAPEEGRQRLKNEAIRLVAALVVATVAELLAFAAPETFFWKVLGMGVAAIAIALSGFSVFRKGLSSLLSGKLNINALMSVAVAGAFVLGEWPEAAMVMALYALAELIEARAVDRARTPSEPP